MGNESNLLELSPTQNSRNSFKWNLIKNNKHFLLGRLLNCHKNVLRTTRLQLWLSGTLTVSIMIIINKKSQKKKPEKIPNFTHMNFNWWYIGIHLDIYLLLFTYSKCYLEIYFRRNCVQRRFVISIFLSKCQFVCTFDKCYAF